MLHFYWLVIYKYKFIYIYINWLIIKVRPSNSMCHCSWIKTFTADIQLIKTNKNTIKYKKYLANLLMAFLTSACPNLKCCQWRLNQSCWGTFIYFLPKSLPESLFCDLRISFVPWKTILYFPLQLMFLKMFLVNLRFKHQIIHSICRAKLLQPLNVFNQFSDLILSVPSLGWFLFFVVK